MSLLIELQIADDLTSPPLEQLQHWLAQAGEHLDLNGEMVIRIVDGEEMSTLNGQYRATPKETNVLAFPFDAPIDLPLTHYGDVIIALPVVEREAREQGKGFDAHLAHLALHGLLHLLGHDHQQESEAARMEALEIKLLAELGFPNPYSGDDAPRRGDTER